MRNGGHEVVGPGVEDVHGVLQRGAGGEHDHRQGAAGGPEFGEDGGSVQAGQAEVEHHQIGLARAGEVQGGAAVGSDGDGVSVGGQALGEERGDPRFVFSDQDAGHANSSASSAGRFGCDGKISVNTAPTPVGLSVSSTRPSCAAVMAVTMASPSPLPRSPAR